MDKETIKKNYSSKIKLLIKYNKSYYINSAPLVSDKIYDDLKNEILSLENKYNFLSNKDSPSNNVGFSPSKTFEKFKHKEEMYSLSNAFDEKDLKNFEKKINNYLDKKITFDYSVEPKIDGVSASLTYINKKLIYGASRGDGKIGELITENLKTIKDIPQEIKNNDFPDNIEIRGEVFIKKKEFEKIKGNFANPRNAASGSLRQKNPNETKKIPLNFVAYTFGYFEDNKFRYQSEFLKSLKKWGFKTNKQNIVLKKIENLLVFHKEFEKKRFEIDYDVDGLVYKINDLKLQQRLGFTSNAPRWAIAHKFSADSAVSEILNIEVQVGRTGALTPVAKIKPVNIGGVVVSNATLHNEDEIIRKDIRRGDIVKIERAGDVIPHVIEVDKSKRKAGSKPFNFPTKCPSCGSQTEKEFNKSTKKYDAVRRCTNDSYDCEKIAIEKMKHFISKEAMNIDGLGKKVIEKFWNLKIITKPQDIYKIDYDRILKMDGWGTLSVKNLKQSIETSKTVSLERFIFSIGIRHIGIENAKLISDYLKNISSFLKIIQDNNFKILLDIDGIGETQIKSIIKFFENKFNKKIIFDLSEILIVEEVKKVKDGKLLNQTFMFTGKLESYSRAEAKSLIEKNSGIIVSTVSKKLDYLVSGVKPTKRKIQLAKNLKVKIINEEILKNLLN